MSGHSKWATIKRGKAIKDNQRGKLFTKMARNIVLAAQQGGGDLDTNFGLRLAVDRAKSINMPSDNIEKAIKKGTGESANGTMVAVTYEAYGAEGVAILIDCETDNTNRALTEVRTTVDRHGGRLVPGGSIAWQFVEKGHISVKSERYVAPTQFGKEGTYTPVDPDEASLDLMNIDGVEDLNADSEENIIDVYTSRESFRDVYKAIETLGLHLLSGTLIKEASETVTLTEEGWEKLDQLIEAVEELEDVNNVWHNANTN